MSKGVSRPPALTDDERLNRLVSDFGIPEEAARAWLASGKQVSAQGDEDGRVVIDALIVDDVTGELYEDWGLKLVYPRLVRRRLEALSGDVQVRINSPGGDVDAASAIRTMLLERNVTVVVEGLAASAATMVMLTGDSRQIAETGRVMIHRASTGAMGNAEEFRAVADMLEKTDKALSRLYGEYLTGADEEEALALMNAETWFSAEEAVEAGLATGIYSGDKPATELREARASAALRRRRARNRHL